MKQAAAILLLLVLVFTTMGYHFTAKWAQQLQIAVLEQQLDARDYNEASLIEISMPLSLPYYNNSPVFERCDGEIKLNGITYRYVERKIQDGKLIVKCLPDPKQQSIQKNVYALFSQVNGFPQEASSSAIAKVVKAASFEYVAACPPRMAWLYTAAPLEYVYLPSSTYEIIYFTSPWHPPQITA